MKGERRDPDSRRGRPGSRDRDPEQYDDEYRAMEASLTEYLDERVKLLSGPSDAPPAGGGQREGWFRRWRADIYFVITLVLLVLMWRQQGLPFPDQEPIAGDEAAAATPESETTPAPAAAQTPDPAKAEVTSPSPPIDLANPADSWRDFVEGHRPQVASWLRAVAETRGLGEAQVSSLQQRNFDAWAGTVDAGQPVDALLGNMRTGLFEYLYGRWSQGRETAPGKWEKVDLVVGANEYDAELLSDLLTQLGLSRWFEQPDPKDRALQAAVIVEWLRTHQP